MFCRSFCTLFFFLVFKKYEFCWSKTLKNLQAALCSYCAGIFKLNCSTSSLHIFLVIHVYTKTRTQEIKIKWSDEMIETLINYYKHKYCLWNINIADYNNKAKEGIAMEDTKKTKEIYGINKSELSTEWSNQRNQFLRYHNCVY